MGLWILLIISCVFFSLNFPFRSARRTLVGQSLVSPESAAKYPLLMCHGQGEPARTSYARSHVYAYNTCTSQVYVCICTHCAPHVHVYTTVWLCGQGDLVVPQTRHRTCAIRRGVVPTCDYHRQYSSIASHRHDDCFLVAVAQQSGQVRTLSDAEADSTVTFAHRMALAQAHSTVPFCLLPLPLPLPLPPGPLLRCSADPLVQFHFGNMSANVLKTLGFTSLTFKAYRG